MKGNSNSMLPLSEEEVITFEDIISIAEQNGPGSYEQNLEQYIQALTKETLCNNLIVALQMVQSKRIALDNDEYSLTGNIGSFEAHVVYSDIERQICNKLTEQYNKLVEMWNDCSSSLDHIGFHELFKTYLLVFSMFTMLASMNNSRSSEDYDRITNQFLALANEIAEALGERFDLPHITMNQPHKKLIPVSMVLDLHYNFEVHSILDLFFNDRIQFKAFNDNLPLTYSEIIAFIEKQRFIPNRTYSPINIGCRWINVIFPTIVDSSNPGNCLSLPDQQQVDSLRRSHTFMTKLKNNYSLFKDLAGLVGDCRISRCDDFSDIIYNNPDILTTVARSLLTFDLHDELNDLAIQLNKKLHIYFSYDYGDLCHFIHVNLSGLLATLPDEYRDVLLECNETKSDDTTATDTLSGKHMPTIPAMRARSPAAFTQLFKIKKDSSVDLTRHQRILKLNG